MKLSTYSLLSTALIIIIILKERIYYYYMKLTIKRSSFQKLVESVYEGIPQQTSDPCFKNFLLTVTEEGIELIGSDGTLTIKGILNNSDDDNAIINSNPGAVQVPAKYLLDIVRKLESSIVTVELIDEAILYISDEVAHFNLNINRAEDYPNIDLDSSGKEEVTLKAKDFERLYSATSFAVATKGPKELFCGINITAKDNKLIFIATDSYRLARKYINIDGDHHISITVPSKTLAIVSHFGNYENITIKVDSSKALFIIGNYVISSKLYNGEFPNVDRIIPVATSYLLNVNSHEFINSIERITIVGNTKILVNASNDEIEISSKDIAVGSSKEILKDAKFDGERFSIIFNASYVTDAIKALNTERVTLAFAAENRAFLVKSDDESITQVITPIRSLDN